MKKTTVLSLVSGLFLYAGITNGQTASSTKFLKQEKNINVYVEFKQSNSGTKPEAVLEFLNTGKTVSTVKWEVKNAEGKTICSGTSRVAVSGVVQPALTGVDSSSAKTEKELSDALNNASNSVVIDAIN